MSDESAFRPSVHAYHIDARESEIVRVVVLRALTTTNSRPQAVAPRGFGSRKVLVDQALVVLAGAVKPGQYDLGSLRVC